MGRLSMSGWLLGLDTKLLALLQFGASTLLALAGFFIGRVALIVGYRNNFGWKPAVLVLKRWDGATAEEQYTGCQLEVWNRQKYSIVIRVIEVDYGQGRVTGPAFGRMLDGDPWERTDRGILLGRFDVVLEANKHLPLEVVAHVNYVNVDALDLPDVSVTVTYFDPKKNKMMEVTGDSEKGSREWKKWRKRRGLK